ncbi:MAG: hypothetical protein JW870_15570 [Candidatus Delongbacteria bacterium]|nr:hypothetical protein [Candidatus Delongbacteria bacterium]
MYLDFYSSHLKNARLIKDELHALCPFHEDNNPSFSANIHTGQFFCFGCQKKGNAFVFAKLLGIPYSTVPGYDPARRQNKAKQDKRLIKVYNYVNARGELLFQKCRYDPKSFSIRRPGKDGKWIYNLDDVKPVLYRLPEVISGQLVIIVEGEKDADTLAGLGYVATTAPHGCQHWREEYNQYFDDKQVYLIHDNDDSGKTHMLEIAKNLKDVASLLKIIPLPETLGEKSDVTDFVNRFGPGKLKELLRMPFPEIDAHYLYLMNTDINKLPRTDVGNAEAFVKLYGDITRYDCNSGKWLLYADPIWIKEVQGRITGLMINTVRKRAKESERMQNDIHKENMKNFALSSESRHRIRASLDLVKDIKPISSNQNDFDVNPFLLGCRNEILDLTDGRLLQGKPEYMISKSTGIAFNKMAVYPQWEKFIKEIFNSDRTLINFIQLAVGYSLTGSIREQVFFILYGTGANGKSTFLNIISRVTGDYACNIPASSLMASPFNESKIPNDLAMLPGERFVTASEIKENGRLNEERIKSMTGDDEITARFLHKDYFSFMPEFKLWLAVNHKPRVTDDSHGFWRRICLVPFECCFSGQNCDPNLKEKLLGELPGILNWALEGCLAWQKYGLRIPEKVRAETESYRNESDIFDRFLKDMILPMQGQNIEASRLYEAYKAWAEKNGEKVMTNTAFGLRMKEKGYQKDKDPRTRRVIYLDIALVENNRNERV